MRMRQSFATAIFFEIALVIIVTVGVLGYLWINEEYRSFNREASRLKQEFVSTQQNIIRNEVNETIQYIEYMKAQTEKRLMDNVKNRTYEAYSIAMNIYEQNKGTKSEQEIQKLIVDALRNIRFNEGRGYYFIDTLEGDVVLYPILPDSEGTNLINLQDGKGNYALQEEIKLVKEQNEGYITGYWIKPECKDKKTYKKITFVKRFEPYNWYMGSGEYVDDVVGDIQGEILKRVSEIRFGYKNDMYVFISSFQGVELANGVYKDFVGKDLWELEDARGTKVVQEQAEIVKQYPDAGFLVHYWKTPDLKGEFEKMTFVKAVPDWGWVVGSGIRTDEIETVIRNNRINMEKEVSMQIANIIMLMVAVLLLAFILTKYLTNKSRKSLEVFLNFMSNASNKYADIDIAKVHYSEFQDLAAAANAMITERNMAEEKIRNINDELEDRIQERTREIEELNTSLERKVLERTLELNRMLIVDGLTQIYNHKYMYERLEDEVRKAAELKEKFCVIMFDIDHFKDVNDSYGHQCGDKVLVMIANTIKTSIRTEDIAGRYGGEEFIVILPKTGIDTGYAIAEDIRLRIMKMQFNEHDLKITISGGVVEYSSEKAVELVKKADKKLYEAKDNGRNRIER